MDDLTHKAACALLRANAARYRDGQITREAWYASVDAILARRGL